MRTFWITLLMLAVATVISTVSLLRLLCWTGGYASTMLHDWATVALLVVTAWGVLRLLLRRNSEQE